MDPDTGPGRRADRVTLSTLWPVLLGFLIPAAAVVLMIVLAVLRQDDPPRDAEPETSTPAPVSSPR